VFYRSGINHSILTPVANLVLTIFNYQNQIVKNVNKIGEEGAVKMVFPAKPFNLDFLLEKIQKYLN